MKTVATIDVTQSEPPPTRTMSPKFRDVGLETIRVALGAILLWSGLAKLRLPGDFLAVVYGYELTGPTLSLAIAVLLPCLEIVLAACFLSRLFLPGAFTITTLLGAVFTVAVSSALYKQLDITCGCFMAADQIGYLTAVKSAGLMLIAGVGFVLAVNRGRLDLPR